MLTTHTKIYFSVHTTVPSSTRMPRCCPPKSLKERKGKSKYNNANNTYQDLFVWVTSSLFEFNIKILSQSIIFLFGVELHSEDK